MMTAVPSGSTLLYLFADKVAPKDKKLTAGIAVPCKDLKVQRKPLAGLLFAAAFYGLREQGLVSLEVVHKKVVFVKTKHVFARKLRDEVRSGLEGAVLAGIGAEGEKAKTVVHRWFGSDSYDPWHFVILAAAEEAVELGVIKAVEAERGKVARLVLGKTHLEPDCSAIAGLEAAANEFVGKWQNFQTSEPELYKELVDECSAAISSRLETDDD